MSYAGPSDDSGVLSLLEASNFHQNQHQQQQHLYYPPVGSTKSQQIVMSTKNSDGEDGQSLADGSIHGGDGHVDDEEESVHYNSAHALMISSHETLSKQSSMGHPSDYSDSIGGQVTNYQSEMDVNKRSNIIAQWLIQNYESADEQSLPRQVVYEQYEAYCWNNNRDPINAASFGKHIRAIFPNLKTRRLGTRGNSKYHYYGIRIRPASELYGQVVMDSYDGALRSSGTSTQLHLGNRSHSNTGEGDNDRQSEHADNRALTRTHSTSTSASVQTSHAQESVSTPSGSVGGVGGRGSKPSVGMFHPLGLSLPPFPSPAEFSNLLVPEVKINIVGENAGDNAGKGTNCSSLPLPATGVDASVTQTSTTSSNRNTELNKSIPSPTNNTNSVDCSKDKQTSGSNSDSTSADLGTKSIPGAIVGVRETVHESSVGTDANGVAYTSADVSMPTTSANTSVSLQGDDTTPNSSMNVTNVSQRGGRAETCAAGVIPPSLTSYRLSDDEVTQTFLIDYRAHCESLLGTLQQLTFDQPEPSFYTMESVIHGFWKELPLAGLNAAATIECCAYIYHCDMIMYETAVRSLLPDVLGKVSAAVTKSIRLLAKQLDNWLISALSLNHENIWAGVGVEGETHKQDKKNSRKLYVKDEPVAASTETAVSKLDGRTLANVSSEKTKTAVDVSTLLHTRRKALGVFTHALRRHTSLNHLVQAARSVLSNKQQVGQMLEDWARIDNKNVRDQAIAVCGCNEGIMSGIEVDFETILASGATVEVWTQWLSHIVDRNLGDPSDGSYYKRCRQFLTTWSFMSSLFVRDLTLRSAKSFGSFHLMRLLLDEYLIFLIERRLTLTKCAPTYPSPDPFSSSHSRSSTSDDGIVGTEEVNVIGGEGSGEDDDDEIEIEVGSGPTAISTTSITLQSSPSTIANRSNVSLSKTAPTIAQKDKRTQTQLSSVVATNTHSMKRKHSEETQTMSHTHHDIPTGVDAEEIGDEGVGPPKERKNGHTANTNDTASVVTELEIKRIKLET
eukprot:CFRG4300T1